MPEGHVVHRLARDWGELVGSPVHASTPEGRFAAAGLLDGRRLETTDAYGKHLLLGFAAGVVHVHLACRGVPEDPLRPDADAERAWDQLRRHPGPIAAALLDQSVIAGVGNVFRAEALFSVGMAPTRPAAKVTRADGCIITVDAAPGHDRTELDAGPRCQV